MCRTNLNQLEVAERQDAIIRMQSEIINDLFGLLMQHITADEADALPVVKKINAAASLRDGLERA